MAKPFSLLGQMSSQPYAIGERPGGSNIPRIPLLTGKEAWESLPLPHDRHRPKGARGMASTGRPADNPAEKKAYEDHTLTKLAGPGRSLLEKLFGPGVPKPKPFSAPAVAPQLARPLAGAAPRDISYPASSATLGRGNPVPATPPAAAPVRVRPVPLPPQLQPHNMRLSDPPQFASPPKPATPGKKDWMERLVNWNDHNPGKAMLGGLGAIGGVTGLGIAATRPGSEAGTGSASTAGGDKPGLAKQVLDKVKETARATTAPFTPQPDAPAAASPSASTAASPKTEAPSTTNAPPDYLAKATDFLRNNWKPIAGGTAAAGGLYGLYKLLSGPEKTPEEKERERWAALPKYAAANPQAFVTDYPILTGVVLACRKAGHDDDRTIHQIKTAAARHEPLSDELTRLASQIGTPVVKFAAGFGDLKLTESKLPTPATPPPQQPPPLQPPPLQPPPAGNFPKAPGTSSPLAAPGQPSRATSSYFQPPAIPADLAPHLDDPSNPHRAVHGTMPQPTGTLRDDLVQRYQDEVVKPWTDWQQTREQQQSPEAMQAGYAEWESANRPQRHQPGSPAYKAEWDKFYNNYGKNDPEASKYGPRQAYLRAVDRASAGRRPYDFQVEHALGMPADVARQVASGAILSDPDAFQGLLEHDKQYAGIYNNLRAENPKIFGDDITEETLYQNPDLKAKRDKLITDSLQAHYAPRIATAEMLGKAMKDLPPGTDPSQIPGFQTWMSQNDIGMQATDPEFLGNWRINAESNPFTRARMIAGQHRSGLNRAVDEATAKHDNSTFNWYTGATTSHLNPEEMSKLYESGQAPVPALSNSDPNPAARLFGRPTAPGSWTSWTGLDGSRKLGPHEARMQALHDDKAMTRKGVGSDVAKAYASPISLGKQVLQRLPRSLAGLKAMPLAAVSSLRDGNTEALGKAMGDIVDPAIGPYIEAMSGEGGTQGYLNEMYRTGREIRDANRRPEEYADNLKLMDEARKLDPDQLLYAAQNGPLAMRDQARSLLKALGTDDQDQAQGWSDYRKQISDAALKSDDAGRFAKRMEGTAISALPTFLQAQATGQLPGGSSIPYLSRFGGYAPTAAGLSMVGELAQTGLDKIQLPGGGSVGDLQDWAAGKIRQKTVENPNASAWQRPVGALLADAAENAPEYLATLGSVAGLRRLGEKGTGLAQRIRGNLSQPLIAGGVAAGAEIPKPLPGDGNWFAEKSPAQMQAEQAAANPQDPDALFEARQKGTSVLATTGVDPAKIEKMPPEQQEKTLVSLGQAHSVITESPEKAKAVAEAVQSNQPTPETQDGFARFQSQVGTAFGDAAGAWEKMDFGPKFLITMGLGLAGVSALQGLFGDDEGGITPWIMGLLGLGGAAYGAYEGGMLGSLGKTTEPAAKPGVSPPATTAAKPAAQPAAKPTAAPAAGGYNPKADLEALNAKFPSISRYGAGGGDPKLFDDPADVEGLVTGWAEGQVKDPEMKAMLQSLSPEGREYMRQNLESPETVAKFNAKGDNVPFVGGYRKKLLGMIPK